MSAKINNIKIEQRIIDAMKKQEPLPPIKYELGGDYYYRCYWIACNNTVKRYQDYCDKCGQRIKWEGI